MLTSETLPDLSFAASLNGTELGCLAFLELLINPKAYL